MITTIFKHVNPNFTMPYARIAKEKRAMILAGICEGMPMNAVTRILKVGTKTVKRVIEETGEALAIYMHDNFRDLPVKRLELDEQWQFVAVHGQRMTRLEKKKERTKGDFWLWCGIDADTKLVVSYLIGRRDWNTGEDFIRDLSKRVVGPVQIATDNFGVYERCVRAYFTHPGTSHGTETKVFNNTDWSPDSYPHTRKNGIEKIVTAEREAVTGNPDLGSLTTCHIERAFLTVRQQLKRYQRLGLGYSKDLRMHKLATALVLGVYNLVRKHSSLGTTPAVAAGIEEKPWTLEKVVEMTEAYWLPKYEEEKQAKAYSKREAEDAVFLRALAKMDEAGTPL